MSIAIMLLILPVLAAAAVLAVPAGSQSRTPFHVALAGAGAVLLAALLMATGFDGALSEPQFEARYAWIPEIGISFHVGVDGVSLAMVLLTAILFVAAILAAMADTVPMARGFLVWMLLLEAAILGVFLSLDWFLFYLFWELALIPMFFLIGLWGAERRAEAAFKFFLYTLAGSAVMLVGLMAAYLETHGAGFEMTAIAAAVSAADGELQAFILVCMFVGMAVKIPVVPLHGWLPVAHVEAPVPVSMILSGVMLKMGGYGLIRATAIAPEGVAMVSGYAIALAILSIVYGAALALRQDDLKAMVAFSSISHMGFVTLGVMSMTVMGQSGAVIQMFSHGLVTAALFMLVGIVYARTHSRHLSGLDGIARLSPRYVTILAVTLLATMGLPGLSGFAGEFRVFVGAYDRWGLSVALAGLGVLITTAYCLRVFGRLVGTGRPAGEVRMEDLRAVELAVLVPLVALMIGLGLQPGLLGRMVDGTLSVAAWLR